jgi:hypothetical protein
MGGARIGRSNKDEQANPPGMLRQRGVDDTNIKGNLIAHTI